MTVITDPSLMFQSALRATLVTSVNVSGLVSADSVRSGSTRPDKFPCIILANPKTLNLGRASGGFYLTQVAIDLHIWAIEDGADTARHIGGAVAAALWTAPATVGFAIDDYTQPSFRYLRDPDPEVAYCHAVGTAEAVVRWSI